MTEIQSLFGLPITSNVQEDSRTWLERISGDCCINSGGFPAPSNPDIPIYAVECHNNAYIADARFLDCGSAQQGTLPDLLSILHFAEAYFQSFLRIREETNLLDIHYKKPEILLVPPVYVLHRV